MPVVLPLVCLPPGNPGHVLDLVLLLVLVNDQHSWFVVLLADLLPFGGFTPASATPRHYRRFSEIVMNAWLTNQRTILQFCNRDREKNALLILFSNNMHLIPSKCVIVRNLDLNSVFFESPFCLLSAFSYDFPSSLPFFSLCHRPPTTLCSLSPFLNPSPNLLIPPLSFYCRIDTSTSSLFLLSPFFQTRTQQMCFKSIIFLLLLLFQSLPIQF